MRAFQSVRNFLQTSTQMLPKDSAIGYRVLFRQIHDPRPQHVTRVEINVLSKGIVLQRKPNFSIELGRCVDRPLLQQFFEEASLRARLERLSHNPRVITARRCVTLPVEPR